MQNLSWVCLLAISNRKVQNAFLPICLFVLSQIMPHYLQRFGPIAGFRLLGKKVILISCHAKITIRKQKWVFHSDQRCASVSNSGKQRKSAWTLLLSASIPFVLPWIFNHLLNHFVCALIQFATTLFLWQWVLKVCSPAKLGFHVLTLKVSKCRFLDIWWNSWSVPLTNQCLWFVDSSMVRSKQLSVQLYWLF